jgi:negative regulator of flagellin synthesis FlgM
MDINNLNSNPLVDRRSRELTGEDARADTRKQAGSSEAAPEQKPAVAGRVASRERSAQDEVQLSAQARSLKQLQSQATTGDAFDRERVEKIRSAIAEGRYHVDAQRLAENFLDLENILNQ